jgi:membrane protein
MPRPDGGAGGVPAISSAGPGAAAAPPPPPPVRRRRVPAARLADAGRGAGDFLGRVWEKAGDDNIFFLAGAIAFNVLVAFIPLALAVLGIAGTILRAQHADPTGVLMGYIMGALPPVSAEFELFVRQLLQDLIETSAGLLSLGTIFLIWVATRLIGTLRTVLTEIFDIQQDRGIIEGKIFDIKMVLAAGTLFAINVGLTILAELAARRGLDFVGLEGLRMPALYGQIVAFIPIWVMFFLIYRFLPPRRIRWTTALIAATFTAVLFELMKFGFSWYVANVAVFRTTYGNLATLVILIFWIYYAAVAFILGGQVAQVAAMQRIRKQQKERLR